MGVLGIAAVADSTTGIVDIAARGVLDMSTVSVIQGAVLKAAAEQPRSIVVDLNDTVITDKRAATIFIALVGPLSESMIGFALYVGPGDTADLLRRMLTGCVPVCEDRSAATAAAATALADGNQRYRRLHMHLAPVPTAAAQARALVDLACVNWKLDVDRDIARSVAGELVASAIQHGHVDMDVSVVRAGAYLIIQVTDRGTVVPATSTDGFGTDRSEGWGSTLVDATSASWGFHASQSGRRVWATLRLRPVTGAAQDQYALTAVGTSGSEPSTPPANVPDPAGKRSAPGAVRADNAHIAPDQLWRQARTAVGLEPTVLSPLTVRRSAARGAIYACLLTDPRRQWAVSDVLGAIPHAHRPAGGMVRSTIYVLLDDGVMERVPFQRVLTARLTPAGVRLIRALLRIWGLSAPHPPPPAGTTDSAA